MHILKRRHGSHFEIASHLRSRASNFDPNLHHPPSSITGGWTGVSGVPARTLSLSLYLDPPRPAAQRTVPLLSLSAASAVDRPRERARARQVATSVCALRAG